MTDDREVRAAAVATSRAIRERIMLQVSHCPGVRWLGSAETFLQLARLVELPDVVILDVQDDAWFEDLLRHEIPSMPLVILTDELDRALTERMLLAGSVAILERDSSSARLTSAMRAAAAGLCILSPRYAAVLADLPANANEPRSDEWVQPLTPRELQILRMLSNGAPNKTIAARLQISEHTAKFHVGQILAKLDADSRTEAVTIGIRRGLILV